MKLLIDSYNECFQNNAGGVRTKIEYFIDNGYSGILSSRPALDKMMLDIVRKQINMVIVKDTSRLTRDKNLTSYFTDIFFPDNDIRFILWDYI